MGGTVDSVVLAINGASLHLHESLSHGELISIVAVGLTNPSNLDLSVGNVTFQLYNGDSFLGTTVLPVRSCDMFRLCR